MLNATLHAPPPPPAARASSPADLLRWATGSAQLFGVLLLTAVYTSALLRLVRSKAVRLALFLPVQCLLLLMPTALFPRDTHILGIGAAATLGSWWASHKSLSALSGYGARLTATGPRALLHFCALIILPVRKAAPGGASQGPLRPLLRAAVYVLALATVGALALPYVTAAAWPIRIAARGLIVYGMSSFISDLCAFVAEGVGVSTAPAFNAPWCAASLSEFWTKRWNLPASDVLRDAVYCPAIDILVASGAFGKPETPIRHAKDRRKAMLRAPVGARMIASCIAFFVSGVMHEVVLFALTGQVTLEMVAFFTLHGALVVGEGAAKAITKRTWGPVWLRVPRCVRVFATISIVLVTGHWLFFPPMVRNAIDHKAGSNMQTLFYGVAPRRLAQLGREGFVL